MRVHDCGTCGQRVIRALTEARRWQTLDPLPDANGNVAAYRDAAGTWHARTLAAGQLPGGAEKLFAVHFATCPKSAERRRHSAKAPVKTSVRRTEQPGLFIAGGQA